MYNRRQNGHTGARTLDRSVISTVLYRLSYTTGTRQTHPRHTKPPLTPESCTPHARSFYHASSNHFMLVNSFRFVFTRTFNLIAILANRTRGFHLQQPIICCIYKGVISVNDLTSVQRCRVSLTVWTQYQSAVREAVRQTLCPYCSRQLQQN